MLAQEFELVITRDDWDAAAEVLLEEARKIDVPPIELDSAFYCSHCAIGRKANQVFPGLIFDRIGRQRSCSICAKARMEKFLAKKKEEVENG